MDAHRSEGSFIVRFDPPGVDPESVDVNVERDVLTVGAEFHPADVRRSPRERHRARRATAGTRCVRRAPWRSSVRSRPTDRRWCV
ncbi:Hsp20 family protein [Streptomyces sp. Ru72]|uniref:Hsp20 family protein n=1 Tax=Streptomyces sp. Ru72 TaxID=2080747 RepID=UPI0035BE85C0